MRCLRRVVAGNPFYPLSAALVLLGVFLLAGDERLFASEAEQLHFNFGAVEAYGFIIVATAVFLVRRVIYYDTLMLVVLAGLPILVPFILISQGAQLGRTTMIILCGLAALLGTGQFAVLRRGIRQLPISTGLPWLLGFVLLFNLALPIALKEAHARLDAIDWAVQQDRHWHLGWTLLLPALVLGAFALPRQRHAVFGDCRAGWLTLSFVAMLLAGTGAHFASLGYVYSFPWRNEFVCPTIWLLAWLAYHRRGEWTEGFDRQLARLAIALPGVAAAMAILQAGSATLLWLNLTNLAAFGVLSVQRESRQWTLPLAAASLAGTILSLPASLLAEILGSTDRLWALTLTGSVIGLLVGCRYRTPAATVTVAFSTLAPVWQLWSDTPDGPLLLGQIGTVTWWLHSLTWPAEVPRYAGRLRDVVFGCWALHALAWWSRNGGDLTGALALSAATMALASAWFAWQRRSWPAIARPLIACAVLALPGMDEVGAMARSTPGGLWLLLIGLASFAAGTAAALWRKRTHEHGR
ncbi:MAG TPA: hypothetical protein DCY13_04575 [Verrucomicrobiales bacterium]|nr:hypothetical protein [Verrucomicrobiales bacterium]